MSRESLNAFAEFVHLPENQTIEEELHAIPTQESFVERSVELGNRYGYEFTMEEMRSWLYEIEESVGDLTYPHNEYVRSRQESLSDDEEVSRFIFF